MHRWMGELRSTVCISHGQAVHIENNHHHHWGGWAHWQLAPRRISCDDPHTCAPNSILCNNNIDINKNAYYAEVGNGGWGDAGGMLGGR